MKNFALLTILMSIGFVSFSQVKIINKNNPTVAINGTEIVVNGNPTDFYTKAELVFINNSGLVAQFKLARKRIVAAPSVDAVVDNTGGHQTFDADYFITPNFVSVNSADSSSLVGWLWNNNMSYCAIHRYYVLDAAELPVDSVDVKFLVGGEDCFLNVEVENDLDFKIYPNPATNFLNININSSTNSYDFKVVDMIGNIVLEEKISNSNKIDVQHLPNGIYMYRVLKDEILIITDKLIINR